VQHEDHSVLIDVYVNCGELFSYCYAPYGSGVRRRMGGLVQRHAVFVAR